MRGLTLFIFFIFPDLKTPITKMGIYMRSSSIKSVLFFSVDIYARGVIPRRHVLMTQPHETRDRGS